MNEYEELVKNEAPDFSIIITNIDYPFIDFKMKMFIIPKNNDVYGAILFLIAKLKAITIYKLLKIPIHMDSKFYSLLDSIFMELVKKYSHLKLYSYNEIQAIKNMYYDVMPD